MSHVDFAARLDRLEAESAVRRVAARYFQICDCLGPDTQFDELGALFTANARWEGKGRYKQAFGAYDGRSAIVEMIQSYCLPEPHFLMTAHFFSAEHISVDGDGATGEWLMLQTSTYADCKSDLRSAALTMRFVREAGVWRISNFLMLEQNNNERY
jgi:hypothetical protein